MFERLFASKQRPYFQQSSRWDTLSLDLSGARFEITLPPQDYAFPEEKRGTKFNLFDEALYSYKTEPDENGYPPSNRGISRPGILKRSWFTYGPIWRADHIGTLQCSAVVCDISRILPVLNCFNPAQFERLVLHGLYYSYGPGFGLNEHTSPVNWKIRHLHNMDWVYLESWDRVAAWETNPSGYDDANFSVWLLTPIFHDKYLLVSFSATGSLPADASNQAMLARIESIIPSLNLQLSPEGLKQQAEARHNNPNTHYSPNREPEPWVYYSSYRNGNILQGEKPRVIEGPCSPPPLLS